MIYLYLLSFIYFIIPICEPWCWYIYLQNWVILFEQMLGFIFQHHGAYDILAFHLRVSNELLQNMFIIECVRTWCAQPDLMSLGDFLTNGGY